MPPRVRTSRVAPIPPRRSDSCYVYLQLPGTRDVVTCGRFTHDRLADADGVGTFFYGRRYLARREAVPVDPVHLPLSDELFETASLGGIFGALRDASPDAWGRLVIERALGRNDLSELDFLLHSPEDRAGALSFGRGEVPPPPTWPYNRVVRLAELYETARLLEADGDTPLPPRLQLADVLLREGGTSMGGARPKSVVQDDAGLWIAKFPSRHDRWNNAAVEAGMLGLARRCGIRTPEARIERVGDARVLLVARFDRERATTGGGEVHVGDHKIDHEVDHAYFRHRMVSALTVLDADDSPQQREHWSYVLLADELQRWSERPAADREELFRRMVFNALISNLDDHPRNHALIATGTEWRLAPAYDLTPEPRPGRHDRHLAMACGPAGRWARRVNLLGNAARFGLSAVMAESIIDSTSATVRACWMSEVQRYGATTVDCERIAPAFLDEGFEYEVDHA